jgi:hypothetical protein
MGMSETKNPSNGKTSGGNGVRAGREGARDGAAGKATPSAASLGDRLLAMLPDVQICTKCYNYAY